MPIASNLKYWQSLRNMTTAELAAESGVPDATITKIRTGQTKNPNMDTLQRLSKTLQCSINDLTDVPSVDEQELRDLLPKAMPGVSEEMIAAFLTALRNQRIEGNRTVTELRKDRNSWRKFSMVCVGLLVPLVVITLVLVLFMYWDLSHPGQGNILLNYALEHYQP